LHFTEGDDPVQIYLSYKRKETAKRAARNPYRTAEASRALSPSLSSVTPSTVSESIFVTSICTDFPVNKRVVVRP